MTGVIIQFTCAMVQAVCFYINLKNENYGMAIFNAVFFFFALFAGLLRLITL